MLRTTLRLAFLYSFLFLLTIVPALGQSSDAGLNNHTLPRIGSPDRSVALEGDYVAFERPISLVGSLSPASETTASPGDDKAFRSDSAVMLAFNTTAPVVGSAFQVLTTFDNTATTSGGPFDVFNVVLTITLPNGVTIGAILGLQYFESCTFSAPELTCSAISFPSNTTAVISVEVTTNTAGTFLVLASSTQNEYDPNTGNNNASASVVVLGGGSLSGTLWDDQNGDGVIDPGETFLSGFDVYLDSNNNGSFDTGEPKQTTDSSGNYNFGSLASGTYIVRVVTTTRFVQTPSDGFRTVVVGTSAVTDTNFGLVVPVTLTILKWQDFLGDGTRDAGDTGFANWTMGLTGSNPIFAANISNTTSFSTTNSSGFVTYQNLRPGTVTVTETQSDISHQSFPVDGSSLQFTLTSGNNVVSTGYGNWWNPGRFTINNVEDLNGNGVKDGNETVWGNFGFFLDRNGDKIQDPDEPTTTLTNGVGFIDPDFLGGASICPESSSAFTLIFPTPTDRCSVPVSLRSNDSPREVTFFTQRSLTITGTIFVDADGNRLFASSSESVVAGRSVFIDSNNNGSRDTGEPESTTDSSGGYSLTPSGNGTFVVRVNLLNSEFIIVPSAGFRSVVVSDSPVSNVDFGIVNPVTLTVQKYEDLNGNGLRDDVDVPVEAWQLTLTGDNPLLASRTNGTTTVNFLTNSSGFATFSNLLPGSVSLFEAQTNTSHQSFPGNDAALTFNLTSGVNVVSTGFLNWFDPGPVLVTLVNDTNGNGSQDSGESFIDGFEFFLDLNNNGVKDDGEPFFLTGSDSPGTVRLVSTTPLVTQVCALSTSSMDVISPASTSVWCQPVTFTSRNPEIRVTFFARTFSGVISVLIYEDMNGNGVRDPDEPVIQGVIIAAERILPTGTESLGSATSDETGTATFTGVPSGTIRLRAVVREGWSPSTPSNRERIVSVPAAGGTTTTTFGSFRPARISGSKWEDTNGDGTWNIFDGEFDLSGWKIFLGRTDVGSTGLFLPLSNTLTSVQGTTSLFGFAEYVFAELPPGTYSVSEEQRSGWGQTVPNEQSNPQSANYSVGSDTYVIELKSGDDVRGKDFGNKPPTPGSFHGYKYVDRNGNGADDADPRMNGVVIELIDAGNNVVRRDTTKNLDTNGDGSIDPKSESGLFSFQNVPDGQYTIREVAPRGMQITQPPGNSYAVTSTAGEPGATIYAFGNSAALDWGDLPDPRTDLDAACPRGVPVECYRTLAGVGGAAHVIVTDGIILGTRIDAEGDGQPSVLADGDDDNLSSTGGVDDEDGLIGIRVLADGAIELTVEVTDPGSGGGILEVFIDLNDDGVLNDGILSSLPSEKIITAAVSDGTNIVKSAEGIVEPGTILGYTRLRISSQGGLGAAGIASDGEVEDYVFFTYDYGDAPSDEDLERPDYPFGYPTKNVHNGAFHRVKTTFRIGDLIDPEPDGIPGVFALGDDEDGLDDEDGVLFTDGFVTVSAVRDADNRITIPGAVLGKDGKVIFTPQTAGFIDMWFDWNRDGDWRDAGERVATAVPVSPQRDSLTVSVPPDASRGPTFARVRFSGAGVDSFDGFGGVGEVEDYLLRIVDVRPVNTSSDAGDSNPGDGICDDGTGTCSLRAAIEEANASGDPIVLNFSALGKRGSVVITPQSPLPAFKAPIILDGAGVLEIDGSQAGAGANGLRIEADGSTISGTFIHGFDGDGIRVENGNGTLISNNEISSNGGAGINIVSGVGNRLGKNSVHTNGGLGIDLGGDGRSTNDSGDGDTGGNNLQNYPVLSVVTAENGHIEGSLSSTSNAAFTIELFASDGCDASGNGEGQRYLGSTTTQTGAGGSGTFTLDITGTINLGDAVTATATDGGGNTSEFSACFSAVTTAIERLPGDELPSGFTLYQNYPNPFNPVTTIRFSVAERTFVNLEVYDVLGKHVARLVNKWVDVGEYSVSFDASDLPSGIYLYQMTAGSFARTRSLTLLK